MNQRPNVLGIATLIAGIFTIMLLFQGVYTIESGSVGILSTFRKMSPNIKEAGLHFKVPLAQDIHVIDIKMQTAHYQDFLTKSGDSDGVINKPKIIVLDSKNLSIGMEITVQFTPDWSRGKEILEKYGDNYFEKLINPIIRDVIRDTISQYQAEEIAAKRSMIGEELNKILSKKIEPFPFILNDMQLRNIDLPTIVKTKIEEVQLAKQEEQRLAMIEKQATKNQNIKTIEANTKLIELTTFAKAEAEKKRIEADAKAYQILKEAEAVAKANEQIAQTLSPALLKYEGVKKWDGAYPKTLLSDSKALMVQLPQMSE